MEYKKVNMKAVAERVLDKSLQVLHDATYPFAEQKVYEYTQQSEELRSPLHLLGVAIESVETEHSTESNVSDGIDVRRGDL